MSQTKRTTRARMTATLLGLTLLGFVQISSGAPAERITRAAIPVQGYVSIVGTPNVSIANTAANPVYVAPVGPTTPSGIPIYAPAYQPGSPADPVGGAWVVSIDGGGGIDPRFNVGNIWYDIDLSEGQRTLLQLPAPGLLQRVSGICDNWISRGYGLKIEADVPATAGISVLPGPLQSINRLLSTNTVLVPITGSANAVIPDTVLSLLSGTTSGSTSTLPNAFRITLMGVGYPDSGSAEHCRITIQGRFIN